MLIQQLILGLLILPQISSLHVMRQLTFCKEEAIGDAEFDLSFDGDELWYVEPDTYTPHQRLHEFATQWQLKPSLPSDAKYTVGTCRYNVPRCVKGEKYPPQTVVPPRSSIYAQREVKLGVTNTLICFVTDFHPTPVNITWTCNGEPLTSARLDKTQYYSNEDYSFRIFSYAEIVPRRGDIYSCSVTHLGLQEALSRIWEVDQETDPEDIETTVCVTGVILGFTGVAVGVTLFIKAQRQPGPS